jgi:hypothetical protein
MCRGGVCRTPLLAPQTYEESTNAGAAYVWRRKAFGLNTEEPCTAKSRVTDAITVGGVTFTGNVFVDFPATGPNIFVNYDLGLPLTLPPVLTRSGWDLIDVRFTYDPSTDTAYFGGSRMDVDVDVAVGLCGCLT